MHTSTKHTTTKTRTTKFQFLPKETVVVGLSSERPCLSLTGSYLECSYLNGGTPDVRLVRCPLVFCSAPRVTSPSLSPPIAATAASGGGGANAAAARVWRGVVGKGCSAPRPLLFSGRWRRFINN